MSISRAADSGESDPCTMFCCTGVPQSRPRSPRIVPGRAAVGSVAPARARKPSMQRSPSMTTPRDRTRRHELDERLEERLALVLGVVRVEPLDVGGEHLERDEAVALRLDPPQHLPGEAAGESVGLDEDE